MQITPTMGSIICIVVVAVLCNSTCNVTCNVVSRSHRPDPRHSVIRGGLQPRFILYTLPKKQKMMYLMWCKRFVLTVMQIKRNIMNKHDIHAKRVDNICNVCT